jgi:hypothetical protein
MLRVEPAAPPPPRQPRALYTAREIVIWVVRQDTLGEHANDPVTVPERIIPWIAMVFQMRQKRALN